MKKLFSLLLISVGLLMGSKTYAQFRSIPGAVTDSFKVRYPSATDVNWSDKVSSFSATFNFNGEKYQAWYNSKGEWQKSEKKIKMETVPAEVKDGLSKSKYADPEWKTGTVTERFLPGNVIQYNIFVYKNDISRRNLLFSSKGQLLKDGSTL